MIKPRLQPLQTTLYSKKWTIVAPAPHNNKNYGILTFNYKEHSMTYHPNQNASLNLDDLKAVIYLMESALAEQIRVIIN